MNENPVGYRISGPSLLINLYCSVCSQRFWRWGGRAPEANQSYQANLSHFIRIYLYNFYLVKQYNLWNYILFMSCCKIWFSRSLIRTFSFSFYRYSSCILLILICKFCVFKVFYKVWWDNDECWWEFAWFCRVVFPIVRK